MEIIKKRGLIIFWILLVLDCYYIFDNKLENARIIRAFLVPILAIYFFTNIKKNQNSTYKLYLFLAFISSWLCDLIIALAPPSFVAVAIISAIAMEFFYSLSLYKAKPLKIQRSQEAFFALIITGVISYLLYDFIDINLGNYKIPVIIIMAVISATVVLAVNIFSSTARRTLAIGHFIPSSVLFGVAAICIALNKFYYNEPYLDVVTMLTYGYGQSLMVEGFSKMLK